MSTEELLRAAMRPKMQSHRLDRLIEEMREEADPPVPPRVVHRILERIDRDNDDGCWLWTGALFGPGYGHIAWQVNNQQFHRGVHRVMYLAFVGPIPDGYDIDHLCHDPRDCHPPRAFDCPHRRCCNPAHLAATTRQKNLLRGGTTVAARAAKTHCPAGHPYSEQNTSVRRERRHCRECDRRRAREYYWKNREKRAEQNRAWREAHINQAP